jgi:hypothetical protein
MFICRVVLKGQNERQEPTSPLPKPEQIYDYGETLSVKEDVGWDLNVRDGTLLFQIETNLGM